MSTKKVFIIVFLIVIVGGILGGILASCDDSGSNNKYGYGSPKSGESFKDYIQREDPDLYKSIDDRLKSLQ